MGLLAVAFGVATVSDHPRPAGAQRWPYREAMTVSAPPAVLRWALLAALAFAVIGMHSLVTGSATDASPTRSGMVDTSVTAAPGRVVAAAPIAEQVMADTESTCDCPDHDPAMNHSGSSGHNHNLLHLCLAVLVALAGLVLGWLLRRRGQATAGHRDPNPALTRVGRGPPRFHPTGDLLSALCVLRL